MRKESNKERCPELEKLIEMVRNSVYENNYSHCHKHIYEAMAKFPHSPITHNLLGIILEKDGDHYMAMKHFLAAWALDPTYEPANHNLNSFGTFFSFGACAFDETDLKKKKEDDLKIEYDKDGIGRVVKKQRTKVVYDKDGIGRVVRI